MSKTPSEPASFVIAQIHQHRVAMPAMQVVEMVSMPAITDIPGLPPTIMGVIRVRDMLLPVVHGPTLFGTEGDPKIALLVSNEPHDYALAVDSVESLEDYEPDQISGIGAIGGFRSAGVVGLGDKGSGVVVLILDPQAVAENAGLAQMLDLA